jgi:hypothetical protein
MLNPVSWKGYGIGGGGNIKGNYGCFEIFSLIFVYR